MREMKAFKTAVASLDSHVNENYTELFSHPQTRISAGQTAVVWEALDSKERKYDHAVLGDTSVGSGKQ